MKRFAYGFGFETPKQWIANRQYGWDDEDSAIIMIRAENADAARAWGREIADASVRRLFEHAHAQELPNWQEEQYADWIEEAAPESDGVEVVVGELPDLDWLGA
ncbi:MAG: hypothetical protein ABI779_13340 [Acidobacteriota bacterium]